MLPCAVSELRREKSVECVDVDVREEIFDDWMLRRHLVGEVDVEDEKSRNEAAKEN